MIRSFSNSVPKYMCTLALAVLLGQTVFADEAGALSVSRILTELAEGYSEVPDETTTVVVQLEVLEPDETWHVSVLPGGKVKLQEGSHSSPAVTITMSKTTLERIYEGDITAFTAAAKGSGADTSPLELEFHAPAEGFTDPKGVMLGFLQHFFAATRPERILLSEDHSRVVHGAHAVALYYGQGFRSAWYKVKQGQHLNEPGDTNPFPQAFVIISGRGYAKIGGAEVEVGPGESYYIPPDSDHVLWPAPGESLELIWLAWGEGA